MSTNLHRIAAALAAASLTSLVAVPASAQDPEEEAESAAVTWGVTPSSQDGPDGRAAFDYELDPGETLIDFVGISNFAAEPLTVTVYASDAYTTAAGTFDLLPSDQAPEDVGTWVGFNETELTIEPETRVDVPFAILVPPNATPGDHVGGIVAAVSETGEEGGNEFTVERRVGARIHLRVSGELAPKLEPEIDEETYHYEVNPIEPGDLSFEYEVENTGNVRLAGDLVARVGGPWGIFEREIPVAELPQILPGDTFTGTAELERIWPLLRLDVELIVIPKAVNEADAETRLSSGSVEESLWAPPWPQAAVLAALGLIVWIAVKVRKRKRRKASEVASTPEPKPETEADSELDLESESDPEAGPKVDVDPDSEKEPTGS
ncbi:WxL protein peptidoglycan domain-containing protein [Glycomyces buryatensis]|uniref:WxL protein peptidoglycan domain-containing protein n=1 Tax=Glycomyces buryatensis TaxID=2570927 RepID=UPI0014562C99|nr:DUF916 domain-containing protein [Glycomyces buryatensis]